MNLKIYLKNPSYILLTLQKYYTKFCRLKLFEERFIVHKTIMLQVIFQHYYLNDNIYLPTSYTIKQFLCLLLLGPYQNWKLDCSQLKDLFPWE